MPFSFLLHSSYHISYPFEHVHHIKIAQISYPNAPNNLYPFGNACYVTLTRTHTIRPEIAISSINSVHTTLTIITPGNLLWKQSQSSMPCYSQFIAHTITQSYQYAVIMADELRGKRVLHIPFVLLETCLGCPSPCNRCPFQPSSAFRPWVLLLLGLVLMPRRLLGVLPLVRPSSFTLLRRLLVLIVVEQSAMARSLSLMFRSHIR